MHLLLSHTHSDFGFPLGSLSLTRIGGTSILELWTELLSHVMKCSPSIDDSQPTL
jgi:hypothetical protein